MSALVNHATRHGLLDPAFKTVSNTVGATAVILLLLLLLTRALVQAAGGPRAPRRLRALAIVIVPLLLSFVAVEAARFVYVIS